jgi:hypothetical protein
VTVQLAPHEPLSPALVSDSRAWKRDYPWLHRALEEIGPGAQAASDRLRVRIQDELKTTLDFKLRPDGTAAIWCGMSAYDFHHYPTPKDLVEGLAEAYRRELKRKRASGRNPWKMSVGAPPGWRKPVRTLPPVVEDSLYRILAAVLLLRVEHLIMSFLAVTGLTFVLCSIATAIR